MSAPEASHLNLELLDVQSLENTAFSFMAGVPPNSGAIHFPLLCLMALPALANLPAEV